MISMKMVKFRSWKTWISHGKGHGKSWNFKTSKEYEPCINFDDFMQKINLELDLINVDKLNEKRINNKKSHFSVYTAISLHSYPGWDWASQELTMQCINMLMRCLTPLSDLKYFSILK